MTHSTERKREERKAEGYTEKRCLLAQTRRSIDKTMREKITTLELGNNPRLSLPSKQRGCRYVCTGRRMVLYLFLCATTTTIKQAQPFFLNSQRALFLRAEGWIDVSARNSKNDRSIHSRSRSNHLSVLSSYTKKDDGRLQIGEGREYIHSEGTS